MTGWLPKEILDHLNHAGYVAVPKEQVEVFYAEECSDHYEVAMIRPEDRSSFNEARAKRLAFELGMELWKKGFIRTAFDQVDGPELLIRNRVYLYAIKPRATEMLK